MEARDLMIGGCVLTLDSTHKEKVFAQVDAIEEGKHSILVKKECSNWFVNIDWIEPIHLTSEILEKNGFVYSDIPFEQSWQQFGLSIYGTTGNYHINCGVNVSMNISNVHKLQHALRLCGITHEIII